MPEIYASELANYRQSTRRFRNWKIRRFIRSNRAIMTLAYIVAVVPTILKARQATLFAALSIPALAAHFV